MGGQVFLRTIFVGLLVALLGTTAWALVSITFNYELAILAWAVGLAVGAAMRAAAAEQCNLVTGVVAAVLAIASVVGGKMVVANAMVTSNLEVTLTTEDLISYISDDVVVEFEEAGKQIDWPRDVDPGDAFEKSDYPEDVWEEATLRWDSMTLAEQNDYRQQYEDFIKAQVSGLAMVVFKSSFGMLDILFLGLAAASAFKLAGMD